MKPAHTRLLSSRSFWRSSLRALVLLAALPVTGEVAAPAKSTDAD